MAGKIIVVMSTYNGESFLREQLNSVLSQKGVEISLLVRDDGSTDCTIDILKEYEQKGLLQWYTGENIGAARSFWNLIGVCEEAEYYAFCDQDDIWDDDKLLCAVEMIEKYEKSQLPILYFSDVRVVDRNLNLIQEHMVEDMPIDYAHALIKNIAPGCTYVFNHKTRNLLKKYDVNQYDLDIHDWQTYRIASCFGKVIFDRATHMSYRQHRDNQIGAKKTGIEEIIEAIHRYNEKKLRNSREICAKRMLNCFKSEMSENNIQITERIALYRTNWKLKKAFLCDKRFEFQGIKGLYFKLLILEGKV